MAAGIGLVHTQLAIALAQPDLELDERETKMLARATANVSRWYVAIDMEADTKAAAWLAFFIALLFVYGPRVATIAKRRAAKVAVAEAVNEMAAEQQQEEMSLQ